MLGMRHIEGHVAVDLWCGDVADFSCDIVFQWVSSSAESEQGIEKLEPPETHLTCPKTILIPAPTSLVTDEVLIKKLVQALEFEQLGERLHITLTPLADEFQRASDETQAMAFMEAIKLYLSVNQKRRLMRRVTFALPNLDEYKAFEQALFVAFPEKL